MRGKVKTLAAVGVASILGAAIGFTGGAEGLRLNAYRDTGGVPTICYGATKGVKMGQTSTQAACDERFAAELRGYEAQMRPCLTRPYEIPAPIYLALLDFTYNVGIGAACGSTLFALVNRADYRAACNQFPRWVYDDGKVIPGLVNRRKKERDLCMSGLE